MMLPLLQINEKLIINWLDVSRIETNMAGDTYLVFTGGQSITLSTEEAKAIRTYVKNNGEQLSVSRSRPSTPARPATGDRWSDLVGDP